MLHNLSDLGSIKANIRLHKTTHHSDYMLIREAQTVIILAKAKRELLDIAMTRLKLIESRFPFRTDSEEMHNICWRVRCEHHICLSLSLSLSAIKKVLQSLSLAIHTQKYSLRYYWYYFSTFHYFDLNFLSLSFINCIYM